ncbi:iron uptake transporter deferrochelatase/peroxidase subunit [Domibacillus sp. DTU_2020_1001157_1_SI_ALB_TIR_016]|uniref:iron uptake transporter deferrochelatase/peroxidase subunit n=1 Tax=Domibacillus sp. DTU_2020_1001157_1_SI_ALB_TIR_016 TaxID=3077789 RepID=UPI0028E79E23|nr:iron uptake transporter deferrochelatase/peroxidase subunit [Domibacillus sp. DTU_2020_1001157_1_SI_ALB_TIR_016]WNS82290.1 iron uptake transporter deferrochelatase/peroxidase subunit [Domibacillus sp. DTU_2020_1001157_1_SI_ALB_TIR_016]
MEKFLKKEISRRSVLKAGGIGAAGLFIGASGAGSLLSLGASASEKSTGTVSFYGTHQAGITTPAQNHLYFAALTLTTTERAEVIALFKEWTAAAAQMAEGKSIGRPAENELMPPEDTGEAAGLDASNLTMTFGVGPGFFKKLNVTSRQPAELKDLPSFSFDAIEEQWSGGDVCIQACADDPQVAFHAVRNLVRLARGKMQLKWTQAAFQRTKQANTENETPRNLFGFKDGTGNPDHTSKKAMSEHVWATDGWMAGGTYMVVRRVQMFIEVWDRTTLKEQEATFGRHRSSGAPLGGKDEFEKIDLSKKDETGQKQILPNSHTALAHGDGSIKILRRSYSYADGLDPKTGSFDAGLLFISFQRSIQKQFVPIQTRLANSDKLNEYTIHRGSAVFACLPGVKKGGWLGETFLS